MLNIDKITLDLQTFFYFSQILIYLYLLRQAQSDQESSSIRSISSSQSKDQDPTSQFNFKEYTSNCYKAKYWMIYLFIITKNILKFYLILNKSKLSQYCSI